MAKKKAANSSETQFTRATPESLRALASLLGKYVAELESIASLLQECKPADISIRGRNSVDYFIVRLDGYVHNAKEATNDKQPRLRIGETIGSYHADESKSEKPC